MESCEYTVMAAGPERDEVIVKNWREQWLANGRPSGAWTADQMEKMMAHIAAARTELQHQSFVAVSRNNGEVIGSAACQLWSGPMPATHERVGYDGTRHSADDMHNINLASLNGEFCTVRSTADVLQQVVG